MTKEDYDKDVKIADLENRLAEETRWAAYCMGRAIQSINEKVLRKDYLKQFKFYQ